MNLTLVCSAGFSNRTRSSGHLNLKAVGFHDSEELGSPAVHIPYIFGLITRLKSPLHDVCPFLHNTQSNIE